MKRTSDRFSRQVDVIIDGFEGQSARAIYDVVESLAPPVEDVAQAEAPEAATEGEEAAKEGEGEAPKVPNETEVYLARLERIRNTTAAAKNIDTVLNGPCQHILWLDAKKANAAAAESCANADAKNAELKSFCESIVWKQAARTVEDEQVNRPRFCFNLGLSRPFFASPDVSLPPDLILCSRRLTYSINQGQFLHCRTRHAPG